MPRSALSAVRATWREHAPAIVGLYHCDSGTPTGRDGTAFSATGTYLATVPRQRPVTGMNTFSFQQCHASRTAYGIACHSNPQGSLQVWSDHSISSMTQEGPPRAGRFVPMSCEPTPVLPEAPGGCDMLAASLAAAVSSPSCSAAAASSSSTVCRAQ